MSQSRHHSLLESLTNTAVGFVLSYLTLWAIYHLFWHKEYDFGEGFWITMIFTLLSILRGYFLRRLFNRWHHKGWKQL